MAHWPFILGAYATAVGGVLGMLGWSFARMRSAERQAERLRQERRQ